MSATQHAFTGTLWNEGFALLRLPQVLSFLSVSCSQWWTGMASGRDTDIDSRVLGHALPLPVWAIEQWLAGNAAIESSSQFVTTD
jgi:predicted DNA-binding transcriptional regulator AlpA